MNEIQIALDKAFVLLNDITVLGRDAEKLVDIKMQMRNAFQLAEEFEKVKKEESPDG